MENIILNTKKHLGRKQVILDCKFSIESGKEVEKILTVQANPLILKTSCAPSHLNYGGKLDTNLLYVTPSGEKVSLIAVSDFSEVFENSEIEENSIAELDCKIVDITTPSIKSNEVKVACILDISISLLSENSISPQINAENLIAKESFKTIGKHICTINETFDLIEEFKIEDTLNQILKIDTNFCLKNSFCGNGYVVVDANCLINIIYEDENNEIKQYKNQFNFKQELECENATTESFARLNISPLCYLAKTVVSQENNFNLVKYEIPILITGDIFNLEDYICIEDAYSKSHLVECSFSEVDALTSFSSHFFEDTCKGTINIPENDKIQILAFTSPNSEIANFSLSNNNLNIEGVVSTTILYSKEINNEEDDTKTNILLPIIAEFGFNSSINTNKFINEKDIKIQCNIADLEINQKDTDFEIIAKLNFWAYSANEEKIKLLTNINTISERNKSTCALEIFISEKNQNIWNFAKEIGISEDDILMQNPHLKNEIEIGDKIIIYNQIETN